MPIIETPRPIINAGEEHIACAVVVDTSGSMAAYADELTEAIAELSASITDDDTSRGRVELCLITFDNDARVVQPFGPMYSFEAPRQLKCYGMTSTHEAIRLAIDQVNQRKAEYKNNGVSYRQPWIWLFTDGGSNDDDNGSFDELLQMQRAGRLSFYGVGIGPEAEASELKGMHKSNIMLRVSRENFKAAFEFLSASISQASKSKPGEKITMTVPPQIIIE